MDQSRQQRISEHFGELQEQYQQICTTHTLHPPSHSAGTASVGTEQAAAPDSQPPRHGNANAVLHSEFMHPHLNTEPQTRETHGHGQGPGGGGNSTPAAPVSPARRNVAAGDEPTMSEQRLDQLDGVLRTVTQVQSAGTLKHTPSCVMQSAIHHSVCRYTSHKCTLTDNPAAQSIISVLHS